jgi:hypothetical protein
MEKAVNRFIKHTVLNLERALELDDDELTLAVLINLSSVIESYVEAMQLERV